MPPQQTVSSSLYEARIILALEALQNNEKLSLGAAAKIYNVDHTTLFHRRAGQPARHDTVPNSRKLTELEEQTIVRYIVELAM
jgi:hypothetical protein